MATKFFEDVSVIRILGNNSNKSNCVHEEFKRSAFCHSIKNILSSRLLYSSVTIWSIRWNLLELAAPSGVCTEPTFRGPWWWWWPRWSSKRRFHTDTRGVW